MKPKSLKQWIDFYEKKTGDKFVVRPDYRLYYLAERGFCTMKIDVEGKMLVVEYACGDGKFWLSFAELKAGELNLDYIGTFCNRNIETYLEAYSAEILCIQNIEKDKKRYLCQDALGRKVTALFHIDRGEKLPPQYMVVLYLKEKATTSWAFRPFINKKDGE